MLFWKRPRNSRSRITEVQWLPSLGKSPRLLDQWSGSQITLMTGQVQLFQLEAGVLPAELNSMSTLASLTRNLLTMNPNQVSTQAVNLELALGTKLRPLSVEWLAVKRVLSCNLLLWARLRLSTLQKSILATKTSLVSTVEGLLPILKMEVNQAMTKVWLCHKEFQLMLTMKKLFWLMAMPTTSVHLMTRQETALIQANNSSDMIS